MQVYNEPHTLRNCNRNLNLGTTGQIDLNRFSLKETHDLLVSLLDENRVDAEPHAVERIHNLVGGLPLAIRIVGGALDDEKETSLDEFADRLENEKNRLYLKDPDDKELVQNTLQSFQQAWMFIA